MQGFFTRAATAAVFVAVMVAGILVSKWAFLALVLVIALGSVNEFYNISLAYRQTLSSEAPKQKVLLMSIAFVLVTLSFFTNQRFEDLDLGRLFPVAVAIILSAGIFLKGDHPFSTIGLNLTALCMIVLPVIFLVKMYFTLGPNILFAIIFLIWAFDAMGYTFGSLIGKTPLVPSISPKKTVEGLIAGTLLTVAAAVLYALVLKNYFPELAKYNLYSWIVIAIVASIGSLLGDLLESRLKRSLNIKDSGKLLPGHGGFLDRFDAMFIALPLIALTLWVIYQVDIFLSILQFLK